VNYRTEERSLSELVAEMTRDLGTLARKEIELAKVETSEQVSRAAKTGAVFGATAVVGLLALMLLSMAAGFALAEVMPTGAAFAVVGVVFIVVAAVLGLAGKKKLQTIKPVPTQTVHTLRRDVEVARNSIARGAR
jgi:uncharacterized membrane protein YqjE